MTCTETKFMIVRQHQKAPQPKILQIRQIEIFFFPVKLIFLGLFVFCLFVFHLGNRIASLERIQVSKVTLAITVVLGHQWTRNVFRVTLTMQLSFSIPGKSPSVSSSKSISISSIFYALHFYVKLLINSNSKKAP